MYLVIPSSTRKDSLNKALGAWTTELLESQKKKASLVDLADYEMPLYNGDLESTAGIPETAKSLATLISKADCLIFCTPEYNGFFPPLTKNTLDWLSRADGNCLRGKNAILMSASPGNLGGVRGFPHLRVLLANLGVNVQAKQLAIPKAQDVLQSKDAATADKILSLLT